VARRVCGRREPRRLQHALFRTERAVEILHRNRRPDPAFIAAFDTLKQSCAMLVKVLNQAHATSADLETERVTA
jgi:hypothetical protein